MTIDVIQNPMFIFLAEEANIAWQRWDDQRMANIVLRDENRVLNNDLVTLRAVVRELMDERDELEQRYARRGHALQASFNRNRELRNELVTVRRVQRLHANPMFRRIPPSFNRVLAQEESGSETVAETTDEEPMDQRLERLGQEGSDDNFSENEEI